MIASLLPWMILAAVAGEPATVASASAGAPADARPSGEELFRRGVSAYDAREYASAIDWFKKAYAADAEPAILFNIAQAYRALGDCNSALENVETFLRTAREGDPLIVRAKSKKEELKTCAAAAKETATPLQPRSESPPAPAVLRQEMRRDPPNLRLVAAPAPSERPPFFRGAAATTCAISAGGALALGLASLGFNIAANSLADQVDSATTWTPEVASDDAQSRALGKAGMITAIAAGGMALIAGTSCAIRWRQLHDHDR